MPAMKQNINGTFAILKAAPWQGQVFLAVAPSGLAGAPPPVFDFVH